MFCSRVADSRHLAPISLNDSSTTDHTILLLYLITPDHAPHQGLRERLALAAGLPEDAAIDVYEEVEFEPSLRVDRIHST